MTAHAPLKLATLAGSLRSASFSRAIAAALPGLAPAETSIAGIVSPGALPHLDTDLLTGGVPATVAEMAAQITAADGVVLVSPEYNWSIPGVLKNALDWTSRLSPLPLKDKPVLIITSSPGLLGGARAHEPIRQVLHSLDCRILVKPEIQIAQVAGKVDPATGTIKDAATAAFLTERLADFAAFIRRHQA